MKTLKRWLLRRRLNAALEKHAAAKAKLEELDGFSRLIGSGVEIAGDVGKYEQRVENLYRELEQL